MISSLMCLAMAVYFEARGEPLNGQIAVSQVIMNRVESKQWPNTVCDVVKQPHQFTFYWDGKPEIIENWEAFSVAEEIAMTTLQGGYTPVVSTDTYYYHSRQVHPKWNKKMMLAKVVGNHVFWRPKN